MTILVNREVCESLLIALFAVVLLRLGNVFCHLLQLASVSGFLIIKHICRCNLLQLSLRNSCMSSTWKSHTVVPYDELLKWQYSLPCTTIFYYYTYNNYNYNITGSLMQHVSART